MMSTSRQWEYYVETLGSIWKGPKDENLAAILNELGEQGWEVFSLAPVQNSEKIRLAAKRPLASPVKKHTGWP